MHKVSKQALDMYKISLPIISKERESGMTKENHVKQYFQQRSSAMLMGDGTKARPITCQFYARNWK